MGQVTDWFFREVFPEKAEQLDLLRSKVSVLTIQVGLEQDRSAALMLELTTLKNKIVERAQVTPILKAKSAAEVRRIVEEQNEREFEEQNAQTF